MASEQIPGEESWAHTWGESIPGGGLAGALRQGAAPEVPAWLEQRGEEVKCRHPGWGESWGLGQVAQVPSE